MWSTETGLEPIHQYQHLRRVQALDLSPDSPALASASGPDVRVDAPDEQGYWKSRCLVQLPTPVSHAEKMPTIVTIDKMSHACGRFWLMQCIP